jgi:uncharacterized membrane protein
MEIQKENYKVSLKEIKFLGGIGSILIVLSLTPIVGLFLDLIGLILILIALKKLSNVTKNEKIFRDYLIASLLRLIGNIIGVVIFGVSIFRWVSGAKGGGNFLIPWILVSLGGYFLLKSFGNVAKFTGEKLFTTTGILILIGTLLRILLIGYIIEFFGNLLAIVSFFSLKDEITIKEK